PIDLGAAVDGELLAIPRIAGPDAHIGSGGAGGSAIDADGVKLGHEIVATLRREEHRAGIGGPAEHGVVGGMKSELLRYAGASGNDEDIEIAVAVGGKGDPAAVRGKARIDVARLVDGQTGDV